MSGRPLPGKGGSTNVRSPGPSFPTELSPSRNTALSSATAPPHLRPRRLARSRLHSVRPSRRQAVLGPSAGRPRPPAQLRPGVSCAGLRASRPLAALPTSSRLLVEKARGAPPAGGQCAPSTPPLGTPTAPRPQTWGLYAGWLPQDPARPSIGSAASRRRGGGTQGGCDSRNAAPGVPDFGGCTRVASPRRDRRVHPPPLCGRKERNVPFFRGIVGS